MGFFGFFGVSKVSDVPNYVPDMGLRLWLVHADSSFVFISVDLVFTTYPSRKLSLHGRIACTDKGLSQACEARVKSWSKKKLVTVNRNRRYNIGHWEEGMRMQARLNSVTNKV